MTSDAFHPAQPFFAGRVSELRRIAEAIAPGSPTWGAVIEGPPGIGKTALARRAALLADTAFAPEIFPEPAGPTFAAFLAEFVRRYRHPDAPASPGRDQTELVRSSLAAQPRLLVVNGAEAFASDELAKLIDFFRLLPSPAKAIVTTRDAHRFRASPTSHDSGATIIELDRLEWPEARELLLALAETNAALAAGSEKWRPLYNTAEGNPLILRWLASSAGRKRPRHRSLLGALVPPAAKTLTQDEDRLACVFGELLDRLTTDETEAMAALSHFTLPANLERIHEIATCSAAHLRTAVGELTNRGLLSTTHEGDAYALDPHCATLIRHLRPEQVEEAGGRLRAKLLTFMLENGAQNYDRFPRLEAAWTTVGPAVRDWVAAGLSLIALRQSLWSFLFASARWDELLGLCRVAEAEAIAADDFAAAGWHATDCARVHYAQALPAELTEAAVRVEAHWAQTKPDPLRRAWLQRLHYLQHMLAEDYSAAAAAADDANRLAEGGHLEQSAIFVADIAEVERRTGDLDGAGRHFRVALRLVADEDYDGRATCHLGLARIAYARNRWRDAEDEAHSARELAEGIHRLDLICSCHALLAKALAGRGVARIGLSHAQRANQIAKSLGRQSSISEAEEALRLCSPQRLAASD